MINAIGLPLIKNPFEITERDDALLKAAFLYRVPAFVFSIYDVDIFIQTGKLPAKTWDGNGYCSCEIDIPKYTEVFCSISTALRKYPSQMKWLYENTVFTDYIGFPKQLLQNKMLLSPLFRYAVPTVPVSSYSELVSVSRVFRVSFVKPAGGLKGIGTMKLEKKNDILYYSTPEGEGILTEEAFSVYYAGCGYGENEKLLVEPCLNILNDDGRAVDFRCLVSLNGKGVWQNVLTYARIGGSGVTSNFSHGGSLNFAEDVLEELFSGQGARKFEEINQVALQVADYVRQISSTPISWLGIDICVDRPSGQVYVLEANSKPGTKLVGPWQLSLVRAQYFGYLLGKNENM